MFGQSSVVSWSVDLPAECGTVSVQLNRRGVERSGSQTVTPSATSRFDLTVIVHRGLFREERKASARVIVDYSSHVVIDQSTSSPRDVLPAALDSPNATQTIELSNVEIDLTGHSVIFVGDNRSLIAAPTCARGPRRNGPRIFVTDEGGQKPLFAIIGDNVLISGFRLEGPTNGISKGDRTERGIVIDPFARRDPIEKIEISNIVNILLERRGG